MKLLERESNSFRGNVVLSDETISKAIYCIRCIAILSVITAHVNSKDTSNYLSKIITYIWGIISGFGVPIFMITGGYYYQRKKGDSLSYWKRKLSSTIIPWVIASMITYTLTVVNGTQFSIHGYMKWLLGYRTLYYYMTVYLMMILIFKIINSTGFLLASIVITFISLFMEQIGLYGDYENTILTMYLNPLNWIGFFAFGILIKRYRLEQLTSNKTTVVSFFVFLIFSMFQCLINRLSYFSVFNPITQTALLIFIFGLLTYKANITTNRIITFLGMNTLIIYLYHIQIVQFILNRLPKIWIMQLIKPILGLAIMTIITYIGYLLLLHTPYGRTLMKIIGIKELE